MPLRNDELLAVLRCVKARFKVRPQLWKDRTPACLLPVDVLSFDRVNQKSIPLPVHIGPFQSLNLTRATKPAEPHQSEDQPPFCIRASFKNPVRQFTTEKEPVLLLVAVYRNFLISERILFNQLSVLREKLGVIV